MPLAWLFVLNYVLHKCPEDAGWIARAFPSLRDVYLRERHGDNGDIAQSTCKNACVHFLSGGGDPDDVPPCMDDLLFGPEDEDCD